MEHPFLRAVLRWVAFYRPGRVARIESVERDPADPMRWDVIAHLSDGTQARLALLIRPDRSPRCWLEDSREPPPDVARASSTLPC